jgi:uncharacterized protein YjeT (DUF2065 family)
MDTRLILIGLILPVAGTIAFAAIDRLIKNDLRVAGALKIAPIVVGVGIFIWLR